MSEHKATIKWSRGGKDFTYKTYSRDHTWIVNGNEIPASATTAYLGNPNRVDPEAALVAAVGLVGEVLAAAGPPDSCFVLGHAQNPTAWPSVRRSDAAR